MMVGRYLLLSHRFARFFINKRGERFVARWVRRFQRLCYTCEISRHAVFDGKVRFPHPQGIVIGSGARIGDGVKIYQGVTIGGSDDINGTYTSIGKGTVIYPNCIVINRVDIGEYSIIGAGSVVRCNIPSYTVAAGVPARIIRDGSSKSL